MSPSKSPRAKKPGTTEISLPSFAQKVSIDGHDFSMQLDDVAMLRKVLDAGNMARELDAGQATEGVVDSLVAVGATMKEAIDLALGDGAHDVLFGVGRLPIGRQMALLAALERIAAPAYDKVMAEHKAAN